jgi:hypothetical protein
MTEPPAPGPDPRDAGAPRRRKPLARSFRWQAFFRRSAEPVFVLDRHRRLLFVNDAWEALTGTPASEAHHLVCRRPRPAAPGDPPQKALEHALTPPPEALAGAGAHVRRMLPRPGAAPRWWDVEFFPLRQQGEGGGVLILGRITPVPADDGPTDSPLPERLVALRERAVRRDGLELLEGASPAARRLAAQVRLAAGTDSPVLLVGEPGAGKRTLARLIHYLGPRRERPFAALDCRRLPPAAAADCLLGGTPGDPGAVYLHEPGRLPRDIQSRFCARPTGGGPRLLAGCDGDPGEEVRAGRLLEDLYAELAVLTIHVPPLRERRDELPVLVQRLLARCDEDGETRVKGLTPEAWEVVRGHSWPGNLRELYGVLAAARRRAKGERIDAADLPAPLRLLRRLAETPGRPSEKPLPLDELLRKAERRLIELALRRTGGHKTRAAEILSIWRMRLSRRMQALGIDDAEGETSLDLELDADEA